MAKWKKQTLKLKDTHGWTAKPGCRIFVADRGAVRFDFPVHWIMEPTSDSIQFHDRPPPDDDCRLAVSYQRLPAIDWSGAPLADMLRQVIDGDPRGLTLTGEVIEVQRPDLHLVWGEGNFIDAKELRAAIGRMAIGIGLNIQVLRICAILGEGKREWAYPPIHTLQRPHVSCSFLDGLLAFTGLPRSPCW